VQSLDDVTRTGPALGARAIVTIGHPKNPQKP